ncbi:Gem-associated protein 5 [Sparganum proliferum]
MERRETDEKEAHQNPLSPSAVVVPRGPTWFRTNAIACSAWFSDSHAGFCDVAFISYEFITIFALHLGEQQEERGYFLKFQQQFKAHEENISAITSCSPRGRNHVCRHFLTCGSDSLIKIWKNATGLWALDDEVSLRQGIIPNALAALTFENTLHILSGSTSGHVIVLSTSGRKSANVPLVKKLEKDSVSSCCWGTSDDSATGLLALVGFKNGIVCGYTYKQPSLSSESTLTPLLRVSAHDYDLCSLSFIRLDNGTPSFITCGRDSTAKAWSFDGSKCIYSTRFQHRRVHSNEPEGSAGKAWISATAIAEDLVKPSSEMETSVSHPFALLCDSKGEIFTWNGESKPQACEPTMPRHSGVVFSIIAIPQSPGLFVTIGMDGQLIVWQATHGDWQKLKPVTSHVYFTSKITSMSQGPGSCSPLAVGLSDGSIAIIKNVVPSAPNCAVSMDRVYPLGGAGSSIGIMSLAWHPDPQYENLLAVGSTKGHVDVIDLTKFQKNGRPRQNKLSNPLGGPVYRVAWGPLLFGESTDDESPRAVNQETEDSLTVTQDASVGHMYAYAVCKSSIYLRRSSQKPLVLLNQKLCKLFSHSQTDGSFADIAFRPLTHSSLHGLYSCFVALGSSNGSINILGLLASSQSRRTVVHLCRVSIHKKCINSMAWSFHPDKAVLAVGSNHSFITVSDFSDFSKKSPVEPVQLTNCLATLEGHGNRVTGLDWSTHDTSLLLSSSFDCTAAVWRITPEASAAIASYRSHVSRVFSCAWNRQLPDLAITGEEFGYLAGWRPSEQPHKAPSSSRKNRLPLPTHNRGDSHTPETQKDEEYSENADTAVPPKPTEVEEAPATSNSTKVKRGISTKQLPFFPSFFASFAATPATDCSMLALQHLPPVLVEWKMSVLMAFSRCRLGLSASSLPEFDLLLQSPTSRKNLVRHVEREAQSHLQLATGTNRPRRLDVYFCLLLWLGRAECAAKACFELQHSPFWLMWALELMLKGGRPRPLTGSSLLDVGECTDAPEADFLQQKVLQLRDVTSEHGKAATLLVCANRTVDAVRLLLGCGRVKEALVLFRLRLSATLNPDLYKACLTGLAERQAHTGLPHSALCHLASGQTDKAIDLILNSVPHSAPLIDHIAVYWTAFSVLEGTLPSNTVASVELLAFKLALTCVRYAADFEKLEEQRDFLSGWRDTLHSDYSGHQLLPVATSARAIAQWILVCARFVLPCTVKATLSDVLLPEDYQEVDAIAPRLEALVEDRPMDSDLSTQLVHLTMDMSLALLIPTPDGQSRLKATLDTLRTSFFDRYSIFHRNMAMLSHPAPSSPPPNPAFCRLSGLFAAGTEIV